MIRLRKSKKMRLRGMQHKWGRGKEAIRKTKTKVREKY
jgi:hypothetical protein